MFRFHLFCFTILVPIIGVTSELRGQQFSMLDSDGTPATSNVGETGLTRPRFSVLDLPVSVGGLWMTDSQTGLAEANTSFRFPILGLIPSPPPIVKLGFDYTDLHASEALGLPSDLYQYSIGVSLIRPINDAWAFRTMLGVTFASDNENRSSDSWQFRGGAFGFRKINPRWQIALGAIALGREDLPVVPAIGAIWTPNSRVRYDLILPNPKANYLIADNGVRQQWLYLGGGFNGTTWGYQSATLGNDQLTYGDLRLVGGWRSTPWAAPGVSFVRGRKYSVEFGYSFSRDLEFNREQTKINLDDAFLFRIETTY